MVAHWTHHPALLLHLNNITMTIYNKRVTSTFFEQIDEFGCHIELDGCITFVYLADTEYKTMDELKTAVETL